MEEKRNEIEEAKLILEKDKQVRLEAFQRELIELCKKYNCDIKAGQINLIAL